MMRFFAFSVISTNSKVSANVSTFRTYTPCGFVLILISEIIILSTRTLTFFLNPFWVF